MSEDLREKISELGEDLEERIKNLVKRANKKDGFDGDDVIQSFFDEKEKLQKIFPDRDEETIEHQAWIRINGPWLSKLNTNAKVFEGIIIGAGDAFDPNNSRKRSALKMYKNDFDRAIDEGYVDVEKNIFDDEGNKIGKIDDDDNIVKNPRDYIRHAEGYYREKDSDDSPEKFWMSLRGNNALNVDIPVMTPVKFLATRAGDDVGREGVDYLNPVRNLKFEKIQSDEITAESALELPLIKDNKVELHEIQNMHESQIGYGNRYAVKGYATYVDDSPHPETDNMRFSISNDKLGDTAYTVWVPEHLHDKIDFDVGSPVIVYGEIRENVYNEQTTYNIQAWGLYADPDEKIPKSDVIEDIQTNDDFSEVY